MWIYLTLTIIIYDDSPFWFRFSLGSFQCSLFGFFLLLSCVCCHFSLSQHFLMSSLFRNFFCTFDLLLLFPLLSVDPLFNDHLFHWTILCLWLRLLWWTPFIALLNSITSLSSFHCLSLHFICSELWWAASEALRWMDIKFVLKLCQNLLFFFSIVLATLARSHSLFYL